MVDPRLFPALTLGHGDHIPQIDIVSNIYNSYLLGDILILHLLLLLYLWTSDSGWYLDSFFPFFCLFFFFGNI